MAEIEREDPNLRKGVGFRIINVHHLTTQGKSRTEPQGYAKEIGTGILDQRISNKTTSGRRRNAGTKSPERKEGETSPAWGGGRREKKLTNVPFW